MKKIGISLLAVSLVVLFAIPALAEFDPYGSARVGVFWGDIEYNDPADTDDSDLHMPFGDFSNLGAKFKTGDLHGHVQLALEGDEDHNTVELELLYGTWDFGGGTLLVGQDHTPYTLVSAQVAPGAENMMYDLDNGFIGFGALWDGYQPQITLELANGLYVSLIQPEAPDPVAGWSDVDVTIPKICVGFKHEMEGVSINVGGAYNTYEAEIAAINWEEDIDSYLIYVGGSAALGMVDLQWNIHYGQNLGDFGLVNREDASYAVLVAGDVEDSDGYGGYIQAAFNVDPATITLGCGYTQSEYDISGIDTEEDEQMSYFVNAKIPMAETFFVVPEFTYYDGMEDVTGADEPEAWYLGMKLQMDF